MLASELDQLLPKLTEGILAATQQHREAKRGRAADGTEPTRDGPGRRRDRKPSLASLDPDAINAAHDAAEAGRPGEAPRSSCRAPPTSEAPSGSPPPSFAAALGA